MMKSKSPIIEIAPFFFPYLGTLKKYGAIGILTSFALEIFIPAALVSSEISVSLFYIAAIFFYVYEFVYVLTDYNLKRASTWLSVLPRLIVGFYFFNALLIGFLILISLLHRRTSSKPVTFLLFIGCKVIWIFSNGSVFSPLFPTYIFFYLRKYLRYLYTKQYLVNSDKVLQQIDVAIIIFSALFAFMNPLILALAIYSALKIYKSK